MSVLMNPTGGKIRSDGAGEGQFGANRGGRSHAGVDFECVPGETIWSPFEGAVKRLARPYASDKHYLGLLIESPVFECKLFYLEPIDVVGHHVRHHDVIGKAQDISAKYGEPMTPHIHLQLAFKPFTLLNKDGEWNNGLVYVDPLMFMEGL